MRCLRTTQDAGTGKPLQRIIDTAARHPASMRRVLPNSSWACRAFDSAVSGGRPNRDDGVEGRVVNRPAVRSRAQGTYNVGSRSCDRPADSPPPSSRWPARAALPFCPESAICFLVSDSSPYQRQLSQCGTGYFGPDHHAAHTGGGSGPPIQSNHDVRKYRLIVPVQS